jgi:hypothetical protein
VEGRTEPGKSAEDRAGTTPASTALAYALIS